MPGRGSSAAGPPGASDFEAFVALRTPALLRTAWLLTGDWATSQDLLQSALTRTWQRWDRVERQDSPDGYVRAVMVTTLLTWRRRRWHGETPSAELPEPRGRTTDEGTLADDRAVLQAALAALPPRQRAVIVLRYVEDLSEIETAALLRCSVGTVKSQASKALAKLRADPAVLMLIGLEVTP